MKQQYLINSAEILRNCETFLTSRGLDSNLDHEFRWMPLRTHRRDLSAPVLAEPNLSLPWER